MACLALCVFAGQRLPPKADLRRSQPALAQWGLLLCKHVGQAVPLYKDHEAPLEDVQGGYAIRVVMEAEGRAHFSICHPRFLLSCRMKLTDSTEIDRLHPAKAGCQ